MDTVSHRCLGCVYYFVQVHACTSLPGVCAHSCMNLWMCACTGSTVCQDHAVCVAWIPIPKHLYLHALKIISLHKTGEQVGMACVSCYIRIYATLAWMCIYLTAERCLRWPWFMSVYTILMSLCFTSQLRMNKFLSLSCQCDIQRGHLHMSRCVSGDLSAGWSFFCEFVHSC